MHTAFGELVEMTGSRVTRYGYAGAWGYQEHDADRDGEADNVLMASPTDGFPFLHLGARYYDPALGRFLQRDPIGIFGGRNTYEYAQSRPQSLIDPSGLVGAGGGGDTVIYPPLGTRPAPGGGIELLPPGRRTPPRPPAPDLSTEEELERLKKEYKVKRVVVGCGFAGVGAWVGGTIGTAITPGVGTVAGGFIGTAIGGLFGPDAVEAGEEIGHWDEPVNPL